MELAQGGAGRCGDWIVDVMLYLQHLNYLHTLDIFITLPLLKLCFVGTSIILNNWFTFIILDINYMFDMIGGLILVSHAPKR